jgi:hypothetical protein
MGRNPKIDALYDHWHQSIEVGNAIPHRSAFDPLRIRPWLGHLSIYERIGGDADFLVRLEGTEIVNMTGENWTGKRASEIDHKYHRNLLLDLTNVVTLGRPLLSKLTIFQRDYIHTPRLLLPVRTGSEKADQIFLALYPDA